MKKQVYSLVGSMIFCTYLFAIIPPRSPFLNAAQVNQTDPKPSLISKLSTGEWERRGPGAPCLHPGLDECSTPTTMVSEKLWAALFPPIALGEGIKGDFRHQPINFIPLNFSFKYTKLYDDPSNLNMTADGTILVNDINKVFEFTLQGELYSELVLPDPYSAASFNKVTLPSGEPIFVVCALKRGEKAYRTFFFDQQGNILGEGLDPFYFRQLLVVGKRTFINAWQPSFVGKTNPPMLQEVAFTGIPGGFGKKRLQISSKGTAFDHLKLESLEFATKFKLRWILEGKEGRVYYVLDELQQRIWLYSNDDSGHRKEQAAIPLQLPGRVLPVKYHSDPEDYERWFYSFSRVTGFFNLNGSFIVSYIVPNSAHSWYAEPDEPSSMEAAPFVLCIVRLDPQLQIETEPVRIPGAYIVGTFENMVSVLHPPNGHSISRNYGFEILFPYDFSPLP